MDRPGHERLCWHWRRRTLGAGRALALLALALLAGCSALPRPAGLPGLTDPHPVPQAAGLPAPQWLVAAPARPTLRSNRQLAADFLELGFELEDGLRLMRLTRLAQPITVTLHDAPPEAERLLDSLLDRLRREAGIAIARASAEQPGAGGAVTITFVPAARFTRLARGAACFVVPNATGWEDWRRNRHRPALSWARHQQRDRVAIFLPAGLPPEPMRNCLHEELAQGLGPPNDLYRLPDTVFNDDDFQGVLTGFDMLMLRMWYDPALHPGMSRDQVLARLPGLLARLNPAGEAAGADAGAALDRPSPHAWRALIATALGRGPVAGGRMAAEQALLLARQAGWRDHRLGLSLYLVGRLNLGADPQTARAALTEAAELWHAWPETALAAAHADLQLAAFALGSGQAEAALLRARAAGPVARAAAAQGLSADLAMIEATALRSLGQPWQHVWTEGLALGRLAGPDEALRRHAEGISALAPAASAR